MKKKITTRPYEKILDHEIIDDVHFHLLYVRTSDGHGSYEAVWDESISDYLMINASDGRVLYDNPHMFPEHLRRRWEAIIHKDMRN